MNPKLFAKTLNENPKKALEYLVERYGDRLYAYALSFSKDPEMAQDIMQDVFMKIWNKRANIKITSSVLNYLYRAVQNEFINTYRKGYTIKIEQIHLNSLYEITQQYDDNSLKLAYDKVIEEANKLPPKCKEVFFLSRKEGLTNIEISSYLKISVKTVEAHLTKSFKILRTKLESKNKIIMYMSLLVSTNIKRFLYCGSTTFFMKMR
ncbi:MAG: RNA polymerase sigma-70 factor [Flavobacteriaceae bacterium]|nr:RNA polymerase sigma-70 factor [Flavobacteriaceae bacterium]